MHQLALGRLVLDTAPFQSLRARSGASCSSASLNERGGAAALASRVPPPRRAPAASPGASAQATQLNTANLAVSTVNTSTQNTASTQNRRRCPRVERQRHVQREDREVKARVRHQRHVLDGKKAGDDRQRGVGGVGARQAPRTVHRSTRRAPERRG